MKMDCFGNFFKNFLTTLKKKEEEEVVTPYMSFTHSLIADISVGTLFYAFMRFCCIIITMFPLIV